MGIYINPERMRIEAFLELYGLEVSKEEFLDRAGKLVKVVLVDNGSFRAAGICYNEREVEAFTLPSDFRPKRFFLVDSEDISVVDPHAAKAYEQIIG